MHKKSTHATLILLTISACLVCLWLYNRVTGPQDAVLHTYESALQELHHPPSSTPLGTFGKVGWLSSPRPEACDFLVAEARGYTGSQDAVRQFYQGVGLTTGEGTNNTPLLGRVDPGDQTQMEALGVLFSDDNRLSKPCDTLAPNWRLVSICHWIRPQLGGEPFYVVFFTSWGHDPGYDPRCHWIGW